ncbi:MAG: hypothetical protein JJE40_17000 [Vicinamibacteria bacterium]|nr:hypothetical protein [Vicinamibacteria bacterium]
MEKAGYWNRLEACQVMKQDPSTRLIPVVVNTSVNDTASCIRGIDVGADGFVSDRFNAHELRARTRSLLVLEAAGDPRRRGLKEIHKAATAALELLARLFPAHADRP